MAGATAISGGSRVEVEQGTMRLLVVEDEPALGEQIGCDIDLDAI